MCELTEPAFLISCLFFLLGKSLSQPTPPPMPILSQSEAKNPRINQLSARWQQVWLLALERQRKLNDALDRLEEVRPCQAAVPGGRWLLLKTAFLRPSEYDLCALIYFLRRRNRPVWASTLSFRTPRRKDTCAPWLVVAQWIECRPTNWKVASLIPSRGTSLGCKPGPQ